MQRLLLPALLACLASTAAAQAPEATSSAPMLRPAMARAVWAPAHADLRQRESRPPLGGVLGPDDEDHRYPGFFVGAGFGVFATLFSLGMCNADSNCYSKTGVVAKGVLFSGLLGLGGAVLGGLIPKTPGGVEPAKPSAWP